MKYKILVGLFVMLFLLGGVSAAMEWDNVKDYDVEKREATVTNFLGLGSEIAKIKLVSPPESLCKHWLSKGCRV